MKTTRPTSTPPPTRAHGLGCVTQANWSPETRSGSPHDVCRQEQQSRCRPTATSVKMSAVAAIRAEGLETMTGCDQYASCHRYAHLRPRRTTGVANPLPATVGCQLECHFRSSTAKTAKSCIRRPFVRRKRLTTAVIPIIIWTFGRFHHCLHHRACRFQSGSAENQTSLHCLAIHFVPEIVVNTCFDLWMPHATPDEVTASTGTDERHMWLTGIGIDATLPHHLYKITPLSSFIGHPTLSAPAANAHPSRFAKRPARALSGVYEVLICVNPAVALHRAATRIHRTSPRHRFLLRIQSPSRCARQREWHLVRLALHLHPS